MSVSVLFIIIVLASTLMADQSSSDSDHHRWRHNRASSRCRHSMKELCPDLKGLERSACLSENIDLLPRDCKAELLKRHPMVSCASDALSLCPASSGHSRNNKIETAHCLNSKIDEVSSTCRVVIQHLPFIQCQDDQQIFCPRVEERQLFQCMLTAYHEGFLQKQCESAIEWSVRRRFVDEHNGDTEASEKDEAAYYGYDHTEFSDCWNMVLLIGPLFVMLLFISSVILLMKACSSTRIVRVVPRGYQELPDGERSGMSQYGTH